MTKRPPLTTLLLIGALLAAVPACGGTKKKKDNIDRNTDFSSVGAVDGPVQERTFAAPGANQTLYKLYLRDKQGRPVKGVKGAILVQPPEGLDMRQPRRKTVAAEAISGSDGIAAILIDSDNKPKYGWIGGDGVFPPSAYPLEAAVGGKTIALTLEVPVEPVATLIINDHNGFRVPDAIVTFKALTGAAANDVESTRPSQSDNYGTTRRTNGLGEVKYTYPVGRYGLIATNEKGSNRLYAIVDWNGQEEPLEFQLPPKSMTEQPW